MRGSMLTGTVAIAIACVLPGCHGSTSSIRPEPAVASTIPASLSIPPDVERLAILHQAAADQDEQEAYARLAGAVFQLKELRPALKIFERRDLGTVLAEQRFQLDGAVSDDTAVHVGRLLGVDSVLIYTIQGPSLRDRVFARGAGELPPLVVSSKIIRVESAEVIFHNVVTAPVGSMAGESPTFGTSSSVRPLIREALVRGVDQTISDLRRAFR